MWYIASHVRRQVPIDVVNTRLCKVASCSSRMPITKLFPSCAPICIKNCAAPCSSSSNWAWYQITATGGTQGCGRSNVAASAKSAHIGSCAISTHMHKGLLLPVWVAPRLRLTTPVYIQFDARVTQRKSMLLQFSLKNRN